ncbi:MAG: GAF domain-containing protein [Candidatus Rokubacteria bacterium]|nr:GAF domain-containing protein [Candidatus Rokubacteria bacterium]
MSDMKTPATLQGAVSADAAVFPFRTELSLEPLVRFWTAAAKDDCATAGVIARLIQERLEKAPELTGAIDDPAVIEPHEDIVDVLMSAVFAPASWEQEYGAALVPFQLRPFYATPLCERVLLGADGSLRGTVNADADTVAAFRRRFAYALILKRVYDLEVDTEYTIILTVGDDATGLDRHFNVRLDGRFIDVRPVGPPPALPDETRASLAAGRLAPEALTEILPADRFVLRGFTVFRAVDVTDQEVLSSLKRDLIDKESIVSSARFAALQAKLRTFFRRPDLRLGLAAVEGDQVLVLNYGAHMDHACIFADSKHHKTSEFAGTVYERAVKQVRTQILHDLRTEPDRTCIEDQLVDAGVRNFVVAPLQYQERVIGTLELGSPNAGDLNASHLVKLDEVLPLFAVAVQRSMEELNARVQAFIKEKCTAIHPTVEWRFRRAVLDTMERHAGSGLDGPMDMDAIVFERVYPLYGLADIRGSSTQRALAIQTDLVAQLRLARTVVETAHGTRALPALDELRYRIDRHLEHITRGLKAGDEVGVTAFLRTDVEPLFDHLAPFGGAVRERIEAYRRALDPRVGAVYEERRRFEQSVTRIAETISSYLELEEQTAQGMAPHYFEKQKTDGVDYQIYAGDALLEGGCLDPLCLRNLRLWQLMVTCGIALRAHRLRDELPVPLETTHLVLVQHAPLAIRFRFDEKRFDVDGAYDIRYEIVKKRIDKALIRGTTERVTQPGRIAIVYGQPAEAHEYRGYIEYLQSLGYLTPDLEDVELEELQGVHGLRALRVTVDLANPRPARPVARGDLHAAMS